MMWVEVTLCVLFFIVGILTGYITATFNCEEEDEDKEHKS